MQSNNTCDLCIERVENSLDKQHVNTTVQQAVDLAHDNQGNLNCKFSARTCSV